MEALEEGGKGARGSPLELPQCCRLSERLAEGREGGVGGAGLGLRLKPWCWGAGRGRATLWDVPLSLGGGGGAGAGCAVLQGWPQPWVLQELAALPLIKRPSVASGMAGSAETPPAAAACGSREGLVLPSKAQLAPGGQKLCVGCLSKGAAAFRARRKWELGEAAASFLSLSFAPLARTPPAPAQEP